DCMPDHHLFVPDIVSTPRNPRVPGPVACRAERVLITVTGTDIDPVVSNDGLSRYGATLCHGPAASWLQRRGVRGRDGAFWIEAAVRGIVQVLGQSLPAVPACEVIAV